MRHDVTFPLYVEVDEIYNLACPASPIHYQFDPVQTTKTSVHGAINMLGLAKRVKAKILQASTSEVYGDPEVHPQTESYWGRVNPIGAAILLRRGQALRRDAVLRLLAPAPAADQGCCGSSTPTVRACIQTMAGWSRISSFRRCKGEDITIYGDGTQTRSFCYVDDLIEAIVRTMATPDDFTGPINIGNPREFTMLGLAEEVLRLTGSSSKISFQPLPSDDPKQRQPDIGLARSVLDWLPKVELEAGLAETIRYFRTRLEPQRTQHSAA